MFDDAISVAVFIRFRFYRHIFVSIVILNDANLLIRNVEQLRRFFHCVILLFDDLETLPLVFFLLSISFVL